MMDSAVSGLIWLWPVLHGRRAFVGLPEAVVAGWGSRARANTRVIDSVLDPPGAAQPW